MTTETPAPRLAGNPATGELVNLDDATLEDLAHHIDRARQLRSELDEHIDDLVVEAAAAMDRVNKRTVTLEDGTKLETNAPTEDSYAVDEVRAALVALVNAEVLDGAVIDAVIVWPPRPPAPPARVAKAELNKLKAHDNPRVAAAIGAVRHRQPQRRTLKITPPKEPTR